MALDIATLEALLAEAKAEAAGATGVVSWRWRERLVPKTLTYLMLGMSPDEAEKRAIAAGEYSTSRVYEVSLDAGLTWHTAPADMPVIDIEGNPMPEDRRRSGKASDAAVAEKERRLRAGVQAKAFTY